MKGAKFIKKIDAYEYNSFRDGNIEIQVSARTVCLENIQIEVTYDYSAEYLQAKKAGSM